MSHARERRRAKRSGGKESGKDAPRKCLAVSPLDFTLTATPRALLLQFEPARWLKTKRRFILSQAELIACLFANFAVNMLSVTGYDICSVV